jgi:hypothetical protein
MVTYSLLRTRNLMFVRNAMGLLEFALPSAGRTLQFLDVQAATTTPGLPALEVDDESPLHLRAQRPVKTTRRRATIFAIAGIS